MCGENARQSGAVDAGHLAEHHLCDGHARARIARGKESVGLAVEHHAGTQMHRTAALTAGSLGRVIVHRDALVGMDHFDGKIARGMFIEQPPDIRAVPDQNDPVSQFAGSAYRAFNLGDRGLVAPHRVYCNGDHSLRLSRFVIFRLLFGRGFDHFAAFILAALGADTVREFRLVAVGALGEGRLAQSVMGAAILCARVGVSSFRIRHCVLLSWLLTFLVTFE
jgi:hypothetical protein